MARISDLKLYASFQDLLIETTAKRLGLITMFGVRAAALKPDYQNLLDQELKLTIALNVFTTLKYNEAYKFQHLPANEVLRTLLGDENQYELLKDAALDAARSGNSPSSRGAITHYSVSLDDFVAQLMVVKEMAQRYMNDLEEQYGGQATNISAPYVAQQALLNVATRLIQWIRTNDYVTSTQDFKKYIQTTPAITLVGELAKDFTSFAVMRQELHNLIQPEDLQDSNF